MARKADYYYYPAVFTYEENGMISITFPDLDVVTCAESEPEALTAAKELLGLTLWGMEEDGDPIPASSALCDVRYETNERPQLVDVYMPSIRMAQVNRSVSRTVTLPAWLNAAAQERGINFSQVLQDALKAQIQA